MGEERSSSGRLGCLVVLGAHFLVLACFEVRTGQTGQTGNWITERAVEGPFSVRGVISLALDLQYGVSKS